MLPLDLFSFQPSRIEQSYSDVTTTLQFQSKHTTKFLKKKTAFISGVEIYVQAN